ncbi:hypothetical protein Plo01_27960 [Planobispora longispora]|uniref:Uncharacterized protein n=1 Tax=Planobispora longispora TaxID=28887 RepID=A0A8J3W520_9ACTN|nr:hypothetical protein GCM10020093_044970 [Planobispora longispora]GIH76367.1 hypothetical protein Plo01_27960 [Planobispora longispora]
MEIGAPALNRCARPGSDIRPECASPRGDVRLKHASLGGDVRLERVFSENDVRLERVSRVFRLPYDSRDPGRVLWPHHADHRRRGDP